MICCPISNPTPPPCPCFSPLICGPKKRQSKNWYGAAIAYRLASLRFLKPRHWCVECLEEDSSRGYGREWELAQRELCRIVHVSDRVSQVPLSRSLLS
jgi:hypothetical protein